MSVREKAERCFALARSTTFAGERENAIAQGTRIAQAAGLSLDSFDIPGRARAKPQEPPPRREGFSWGRDPNPREAEEMERMMRRFRELAARQAAARAKAKPRPMYETAEAAAAYLRSIGGEVRTQPLEPGGSRSWTLIYAGRIYAGISDADLVKGAVAATPREKRMQHELSERARIEREAMYYGSFSW